MGRTKRNLKWLAVLGAVVICCAVALTAWLVQNPKQTLFDLDPEQVSAITVSNGNKVTRMDIDDPQECKEIVQLLNRFTYRSTEDTPPAGGWSYRLDVEMASGVEQIYFTESAVRESHPDGSSTFYYGPVGYFRKLVDLAESATDPL